MFICIRITKVFLEISSIKIVYCLEILKNISMPHPCYSLVILDYHTLLFTICMFQRNRNAILCIMNIIINMIPCFCLLSLSRNIVFIPSYDTTYTCIILDSIHAWCHACLALGFVHAFSFLSRLTIVLCLQIAAVNIISGCTSQRRKHLISYVCLYLALYCPQINRSCIAYFQANPSCIAWLHVRCIQRQD